MFIDVLLQKPWDPFRQRLSNYVKDSNPMPSSKEDEEKLKNNTFTVGHWGVWNLELKRQRDQHIKYISLLLFLERSAHTARIRSLKVDASLWPVHNCSSLYKTLLRCTFVHKTFVVYFSTKLLYTKHFCGVQMDTQHFYDSVHLYTHTNALVHTQE